jgi:hypothetical protein
MDPIEEIEECSERKAAGLCPYCLKKDFCDSYDGDHVCMDSLELVHDGFCEWSTEGYEDVY